MALATKYRLILNAGALNFAVTPHPLDFPSSPFADLLLSSWAVTCVCMRGLFLPESLLCRVLLMSHMWQSVKRGVPLHIPPSLVAQRLKCLPGMRETQVRSLGREDPGKIPWRRKWKPTPVLLPGESNGGRSLVGYSPWGRKESDRTERVHFHFHFAYPSSLLFCYIEGSVATPIPLRLFLRGRREEKGRDSNWEGEKKRRNEGNHLGNRH